MRYRACDVPDPLSDDTPAQRVTIAIFGHATLACRCPKTASSGDARALSSSDRERTAMRLMRNETLEIVEVQEGAMAKVEHAAHKRHVYKRVPSPVGRLTLVATDEGLAAILWEHDRPSR